VFFVFYCRLLVHRIANFQNRNSRSTHSGGSNRLRCAGASRALRPSLALACRGELSKSSATAFKGGLAASGILTVGAAQFQLENSQIKPCDAEIGDRNRGVDRSARVRCGKNRGDRSARRNPRDRRLLRQWSAQRRGDGRGRQRVYTHFVGPPSRFTVAKTGNGKNPSVEKVRSKALGVDAGKSRVAEHLSAGARPSTALWRNVGPYPSVEKAGATCTPLPDERWVKAGRVRAGSLRAGSAVWPPDTWRTTDGPHSFL
jgi:hypothetical protein